MGLPSPGHDTLGCASQLQALSRAVKQAYGVEAGAVRRTSWDHMGEAHLTVWSASPARVALGSGSRTKHARSNQGYPKRHWIDAAGAKNRERVCDVTRGMWIVRIEAKGQGTRRRCGTDRDGFPIRHTPAAASYLGERTEDLGRGDSPRRRDAGTQVGHPAIRPRPGSRLNRFSVHPKHLKLLRRNDGNAYHMG